MDILTAAAALLIAFIVVMFVLVFAMVKKENKLQDEARMAFDALYNEFDEPDTDRFGATPGILSAELDGVEFGYYYTPGDKNTPRSINVSVILPSPAPLHITRETWFERLFKDAGITIEPTTGDRRFDEEYYIQCDAPGFARDFLADPDKREGVREIFRLGFHKVSLENDRLTAISIGEARTMTAEVVRRIVPRLARLARDVPPATSITVHMVNEARRGRIVTYGLALAGMVVGVASFAVGAVKYHPLEAWEMFFWSVRYSAAALVLFMLFAIYMLKGRSTSHLHLLIILAIAIPGFGAAGYGAVMAINGHLDDTEPSVHAMLVMDKVTRTSKNNKNYYMVVRSWRVGRWQEELSATKWLYDQVEPGKSRLEIATRPGKLGFEWVVDVRLAAPGAGGSLSGSHAHGVGRSAKSGSFDSISV